MKWHCVGNHKLISSEICQTLIELYTVLLSFGCMFSSRLRFGFSVSQLCILVCLWFNILLCGTIETYFVGGHIKQ